MLTPGRLGLMTDESLLELGELVLAMDRRALTATAGESGEIPDIVEFTRQRLGFDPNPLQASVLRGGRRGIVNCTRQWGKSTVAAAKAVHRAFCQPDSLILVLSPSERQSGELMRKAEEFVSRMGIKVRGDGTNEISIAFPNRSRIVGLPHEERTSRGFSKVSLMLSMRRRGWETSCIAGDASDAGGGERRPVADEHSQRQTGILSCRVDGRGRAVATDQRDGGGMPVD